MSSFLPSYLRPTHRIVTMSLFSKIYLPVCRSINVCMSSMRAEASKTNTSTFNTITICGELLFEVLKASRFTQQKCFLRVCNVSAKVLVVLPSILYCASVVQWFWFEYSSVDYDSRTQTYVTTHYKYIHTAPGGETYEHTSTTARADTLSLQVVSIYLSIYTEQ